MPAWQRLAGSSSPRLANALLSQSYGTEHIPGSLNVWVTGQMPGLERKGQILLNWIQIGEKKTKLECSGCSCHLGARGWGDGQLALQGAAPALPSNMAFAPSCLLASSGITSALPGRRETEHITSSETQALVFCCISQLRCGTDGEYAACALQRLPGPQRCLKQMRQNPARAKTCLVSQPCWGERSEALQHITLPCWGTVVHGMCWPWMDGHGAASQGCAAPVGAGLSAGTWGRGTWTCTHTVPVGPHRELFGTCASHFRGWKARFSSDCSQRTKMTGLEGCWAGQEAGPVLLLGYVGKHSLWCWGAGRRLGMGRGEVVGKERDAFWGLRHPDNRGSAVSCKVAWVESRRHCSGKYRAGGGEKERVWVRRSSVSSAWRSPIGRSMGRCCWMEPPEELEEPRDGAATPVLLPNRERSSPGCLMLYAWTYLDPARNSFWGFFVGAGEPKGWGCPVLAGSVALVVRRESDGEQGRTTLYPQPQRCCCTRVWYTYVSDFTVMHFH